MYPKWIKSGFILAMLLISMVSLSMAGCPWFIKNDLYTAQCGVLKEVPASKGILANDPAGTRVINPELIQIDPKYGTISVYEDGSFVYDPSGATGIRSGIYVIFKYGANNGFCDAKYQGIAKIQVSCKFTPKVELCDGLDNNFNGKVDEDLGTDTCGVGACENTVDKCVDGEPNICVPLDPSPEICDDGIDNDCDGLTDGDDEDCGCNGGTCDTGFTVCDDSCGIWGAGYCFLTTEDTGQCGADRPCAEDAGCVSSKDCNAGEFCFKDTCCGANVCLPLCSNIEDSTRRLTTAVTGPTPSSL
jgi:hypothetical protein